MTERSASGRLLGRVLLYAGAATYLLGQAFDSLWHSRNVSFVPEPPSTVFVIHSGIYLGAAAVVVAGALHLAQPGTRLGGAVVLAGGLTQLTGFVLDTWAHGRGYSAPLYHDLWWHGFAVVVVGTAGLEYRRLLGRADRRPVELENPVDPAGLERDT